MPKKYIFLVILTCCTLCFHSFAQTLQWSKTDSPSGGTGNDRATALAIDATGVYIAGEDQFAYPNSRWRIEKRDLTTGNLISTFGTSGVVVYDLSAQADIPTDMAIDGTGIYVSGIEYEQWHIKKLNLTTGAVIWTRTFNPSGGTEEAVAITVDGTGVYVVGDDLSAGGGQWRIEKLNLSTGALLAGWPIFADPSTGMDTPFDIAVDGTKIYVVGKMLVSGWFDDGWRMEAFNNSTGAFVWGQTFNPSSSSSEQANSVGVDATGVYVAGYDASVPATGGRWRIEKRDLSTGNLLAGWPLFYDPSTSSDTPYNIVLKSSALYIIGTNSSNDVIQERNLTTGALICTATTGFNVGPTTPDITLDATGYVYVAGLKNGVSYGEWSREKWQMCVALPIELMKFNVTCNSERVNITWSTATETNNDHFTIEQSNDGINFTSLVFVDGAGNSTQMIDYSFSVENHVNGMLYYRLKQTDFDGNFTYSYIQAANCSSNSIGDIAIVENNGAFTLDVSSNCSLPVDLFIYNILGQLVSTKKEYIEVGNNKLVLYTDNLERGTYLLKANISEQIIQKKFVIKQND